MSNRKRSYSVLFGIIGLLVVIFLVLGIYVSVYRSVNSSSISRASTDTTSLSSLAAQHSLHNWYKHAAIATDSEICSTIGKNILKSNGSAVDAAIAAMICSGVYHMHSAGIGGGHFMVIYNSTSKQATSIGAREAAPLSAFKDMYNNADDSVYGVKAIAVPGDLSGLWRAHKIGGKLNWEELFKPTIHMCMNGFHVGKPLSVAIDHKLGTPCETVKSSVYNELLIKSKNNSDKHYYSEGDIIKLPELGNTLRIIAEQGANTFYSGEIAEKLLEDIQEAGGIIDSTDLASYEARTEPCVNVSLSNNDIIFASPPPASGIILHMIMRILDEFNLKPSDVTTIDAKAATYHKIIEAFKFSYGKRSELGDSNYVKNMSQLITNALDVRNIRNIVNKIKSHSKTSTDMSYYGGKFDLVEDSGTSHLSVVDSDGNAVSATSTINTYFGSCFYSKKTGIILNNEMDDFSSPNSRNIFGLPPSEANYIRGGKRPQSSMCPLVMVDGDKHVRLVTGASGGTHITSHTAWAIIHTLWLGLPVNEAIDTKRLHNQLSPIITKYESGFDQQVIDKLQDVYGHVFHEDKDKFPSIVQMIKRLEKDDLLHACSDYRKCGKPDGY